MLYLRGKRCNAIESWTTLGGKTYSLELLVRVLDHSFIQHIFIRSDTCYK